VVDSPTSTRFSAPGGYINVTTGLLKATDNEAQLRRGAGARNRARHREALAQTYQQQRAFVCNKLVYVRAYTQLGINRCRRASAMGGGGDRRPDVMGPTASTVTTAKGGFLVKVFEFMADKLGAAKEKQQELDADRIGIELVAAAGTTPRSTGALLKKLPQRRHVRQPPGHQRPHHELESGARPTRSAPQRQAALEAMKALK